MFSLYIHFVIIVYHRKVKWNPVKNKWNRVKFGELSFHAVHEESTELGIAY